MIMMKSIIFIDKVVFFIKNTIMIFLYYRFLIFNRGLLIRNQIFKNIHLEETAYLILNGKSTSEFDFNTIGDKVSFVVNNFYKSSNEIFIPTYYIQMDEKLFNFESQDRINNIREKYKAKQTIFFYSNRFLNYNRLQNNEFIIFPGKHALGYNIEFNPSKKFGVFFNVSLYCMALAKYMGIKKIFIVGLDFEYDMNHFYGVKTKKDYTNPNMILELAGHWQHYYAHKEFHYINKYFINNKIEVINLNDHSNVKAFKKLSI